MMNIAICDDEKNDTKIIKNFVAEYMDKKKILNRISIFRSGEKLLESDLRFDIVFLDIVMGGINGIQAGSELRNINRNTKIIYVTSFSQYCLEAINSVHALAYLSKPITMQNMELQIEEALLSVVCERGKKQSVRFEIIKITKEYRIETEFREFDIDDIVYFEYVNKKIMIKTDYGEFYFIGRIKDVSEMMKKYNFENCHQSYLVNLNYVQKMKCYDLFLKNGGKLPISQKKSALFHEKMNQFVQDNI